METIIIPAFPGALGAGAFASGGRGGTVLHVTTLDWNDNVGSLKWAIEQEYTRIIVFDVSGTINATDPTYYELDGSNGNFNNLTIAGQTAPEGGITIEHNWFKIFNVSNVIIRFMRFVHVGYFAESKIINATAFSFGGDEYSILDHISTRYSWNSFGLGIRAGENGLQEGTTVQRCLLGDSKTGMGCGEDPTEEFNMVNAGDYSIHSNLFAHISHRFPSFSGNFKAECINNIIYNPLNRLVLSFGTPDINLIGNYYKKGNQYLYNPHKIGTYVGLWETDTKPYAQWYTEGNVIEEKNYSETDTHWGSDFIVRWGDDPSDTEEYADPALFRSLTKFPDINAAYPIVAKYVYDAYLDVLADVGHNKYMNADGTYGTYLDSVDQRYIDETTNGTGDYSSLSVQSSLVYPVLPNNTRPASFYVSNDHIPEAFFTAKGITGTSTIHNELAPSGYTWLEEYYNGVDADTMIVNRPIITLTGQSIVNVELGDPYIELGATATDTEDGDLSSSIVITGSVDTSTEGTYYIYYNVIDSENNTATQVSRTIIVSEEVQNGNIVYNLTESQKVNSKRALVLLKKSNI